MKPILSLSFRVLLLVLLCVSSSTVLSAQIDRAREAPYADFTRYYNDTVSNAEKNDRSAALRSSDDMARALNTIFDLSKDAPGRLNDANLRDLGAKAQEFLDQINAFRNKGSALQEKLKRVDESYSSELSAFKSEFDKLRDKFNELWRDLQLAGRDIGKKVEALKAVCTSGCLP